MWLPLIILFGISVLFGPFCVAQCAGGSKNKKKKRKTKTKTEGTGDTEQQGSDTTKTDKTDDDKKEKDKDKEKSKSHKKKGKHKQAKSTTKYTEDTDLKSRSNYDVKTGATVIPQSARRPAKAPSSMEGHKVPPTSNGGGSTGPFGEPAQIQSGEPPAAPAAPLGDAAAPASNMQQMQTIKSHFG